MTQHVMWWSEASDHQEAPDKPKAYCPFGSNMLNFLDQCSNFKQLTKEQKTTWVKSNNRCWRCGRHHQAAQCRLRVLCKTCKGKHLEALHDVNLRPGRNEHTAGNGSSAELKPATDALYLDQRAGCNQVLLKVSKVILCNGNPTLEMYARLDDGSERTILLQEATQRLQLQGISQEQVKTSKESWFIPHHLVTHTRKNHIMFNCSYSYENENLNELLLSGTHSAVT